MDIATVTAKFEARIPEINSRALGLPYTVRVSKNEKHVGKIVKVELARVEITTAGYRGVYLVSMECGANKSLKQFCTLSVPQR